MVDLIALRQRFVQIHRADDRADVGHRQVDHREAQVVDFVRGLRGIEHLVEHDGVDRDHRVVARDHFLARHVQHLFHHVHLAADGLDERHHDVEAGLHGLFVAAEALQCVLEALRHGQKRLAADDDQRHDQDDDQR